MKRMLKTSIGRSAAASRASRASASASSRRAGRVWLLAGAGLCLGALLGACAGAPASWLANTVARVTAQRVLLVQAQGTVWSGSAVAVLSGGPGSRDATLLPGRLHWRIRPEGAGLSAALRHDCCPRQSIQAVARPGLQAWQLELPAQAVELGTWPTAWLEGLGTPFNTLQLAGAMQASTPGARLAWAAGRLRLEGSIDVALRGLSSRMAPATVLGSYQLRMHGGGADQATPSIGLSTLDGSLRLSGTGQLTAAGLRFNGEAQAVEGAEPALTNLLGLIGRRSGMRATLSIG